MDIKKINAKILKNQEKLSITFSSNSLIDTKRCLNLVKKILTTLKDSSILVIIVYWQPSKNDKPILFQSYYLKTNGVYRLYKSYPSEYYHISENIEKGSSLKKAFHLFILGMACIFTVIVWNAAIIEYKNFSKQHVLVGDNQRTNLTSFTEKVNKTLPSAPEKTHSTRSTLDITQSVIIKAVGDIIPGTDYPRKRLPSSDNILFETITPYLQGADILFGNFESTLTNHPVSAKNIRRFNVFAFRTPPKYARLLKNAGFDVLNVANNHSRDFFKTGFDDTIRFIETAGMNTVGVKDKILYIDFKDVRIAFIGFSTYNHHNSIHRIEEAQILVQQAEQNACFTVLSVHAGAEGSNAVNVRDRNEYFFSENRGNILRFSRMMIDAGADLILGHGPHVIRSMELYNGKLIAYSLGNFLGYRTLSTSGILSYSVILEVELAPDGDFIRGNLIPVCLDKNGIPRFDRQKRSLKLMTRLLKTDFPETPLTITSEGDIFVKS